MQSRFPNSQSIVSLIALLCTPPCLVAQNDIVQMTFRGGWLGAADEVRQVQANGSYAYLVVGDNELQVLNVNSPTNPVPLGRYHAAGRINCFRVKGYHAYLAIGDSSPDTNGPGALEILDVSHPSHLVFLSGFETRGPANGVDVVDGLAYVAEGAGAGSDHFGGLSIVCVTNAAHPILRSRYDMSRPMGDVKVADGHAYLVSAGQGLEILDVSDASNPGWVGAFPISSDSSGVAPCLGIEVKDGFAYVNGMGILDVRDPSSPVRVLDLGEMNFLGTTLRSCVRVADDYICIIEWEYVDGSWILVGCAFFDTSNPSDWISLGSFSKLASLVDLEFAEDHAYVTVEDGLLVYDITLLPYFKSIVRTGDNVVLHWKGLPGLMLQQAPSLIGSNWMDVIDSLGTNRIELPRMGGRAFFRLIQQATP